MKVLSVAMVAAGVAVLGAEPAAAGGCPCSQKGPVARQGVVTQLPTAFPLPPPLPPAKTAVAAASG